MMKPGKGGLALGGGGTKGFAHVDDLRALVKEGIQVDFIAGTLEGRLLGAMYAQSANCHLIVERFRKYLESREFKRTYPEFLQNSLFEESSLPAGISIVFPV